MKDKIMGILTPILTIIIMVIVAIITGIIVGSSSPTGWEALGAIMMVFMLTGLFIIVELIVGIVLYAKKQSEFGLGMIFGFVGIVGLGTLLSIIMALYNAFV